MLGDHEPIGTTRLRLPELPGACPDCGRKFREIPINTLGSIVLFALSLGIGIPLAIGTAVRIALFQFAMFAHLMGPSMRGDVGGRSARPAYDRLQSVGPRRLYQPGPWVGPLSAIRWLFPGGSPAVRVTRRPGVTTILLD